LIDEEARAHYFDAPSLPEISEEVESALKVLLKPVPHFDTTTDAV